MKSSSTRLMCLLALAVALPLVVFAAPEVETPEWVGYRYSDRTGAVSQTVLPWDGEPKQLWTVELGRGYSAAVEVDGLVYTMGNTGGTDTVFALDCQTGESKWTKEYPCKLGGYKGPRATPTVSGGRVYTVSREGHLFCWNAKTGEKVWERHAKEFKLRPGGWGFACSPLIHGENVVYDLGKVVALNAATGKTAWESRNYGAAYSSPVAMTLGEIPAIVAFPRSGMVVVAADDGRELAKYDWETGHGVNAATPIVNDKKDVVFIASGYNRGCAMIRLARGRSMKIWENKNMCSQFNTAVVKDGRFYGFSGNNGGNAALVCLDAQSGKVVWREKSKSLGTGSVLLAGDSLVIQGETGDLILADATPKGYKERAKSRVLTGTCWTVPMLFGNRLYVRNDAGKLICLEVPTK